ncbi:MAG: GNAT family N-acetyltransferase [Candidatus Pacearchaeota archaeon]
MSLLSFKRKIERELFEVVKEGILSYKGHVAKEFFSLALMRFLKDFDRVVRENYVLVHTEKGKIVGVVIFNVKAKVGKIVFLAVKRAWQKRGIASRLLQDAEKACKALKARKMVFGAHAKSLGFYLARGYAIIGKEKRLGTELFILEKNF